MVKRTRDTDGELTVEKLFRCDCGVHVAGVMFYVEREGDKRYFRGPFINFGVMYQDSRIFSLFNLKQRIKACWEILRHGEYHFNDVILSQEDVPEMVALMQESIDMANGADNE